MSLMPSWSNDWKLFLDRIVELIDSGLGVDEITTLFSGERVEWEGDNISIDLENAYVPGVRMSMGQSLVPMANGQFLNMDVIPLSIPPEQAEPWKDCAVGESIRFTASLPGNDTLRLKMRTLEIKNGSELVLFLTLHTCEPVGVPRKNTTYGSEDTEADAAFLSQSFTKKQKQGTKSFNSKSPSELFPGSVLQTEVQIDIEGLNLEQMLEELENLSAEDFDDYALTSPGLDKLIKICEVLDTRGDFDSWAEALFRVIERLDEEVDLGSPGCIVHCLEKWRPQYEKYLLQSIKRKPVALTMSMVNRILRVPNSDQEKWRKLSHFVLEHDAATEDAIGIAEDTLVEVFGEELPED